MGFTFLAFAERERLQARRRKETTPERDARLDDQRDRARRRETTPERDARLDDLRERAQARRRRENEHWHFWVFDGGSGCSLPSMGGVMSRGNYYCHFHQFDCLQLRGDAS